MKIFCIFILVVGCFLNTVAQNPASAPDPQPPTKLTLSEVLSNIPGAKGERYALGMRHGTMRVLVYAPKGQDDQSPHKQDEEYIVVNGSGTFECGPEKVSFGPTDVLYVPAGVTHRFVNFSDDLVLWVVFYGVEGGEH